jgi:hypothetical protein
MRPHCNKTLLSGPIQFPMPPGSTTGALARLRGGLRHVLPNHTLEFCTIMVLATPVYLGIDNSGQFLTSQALK